MFGTEQDSLRGKNIILNQILLSKLWYIGQIYVIPNYIEKKIERTHDLSLKRKKIRPLGHLAQLSIWRGGVGILDIDTQLNSLKIIKSHQCSLEDPMLYRLSSISNSNQGLALFRKKQISISNRHKNLQKQNNEYFFIQLLTSLPTSLQKNFLTTPYF